MKETIESVTAELEIERLALRHVVPAFVDGRRLSGFVLDDQDKLWILDLEDNFVPAPISKIRSSYESKDFERIPGISLNFDRTWHKSNCFSLEKIVTDTRANSAEYENSHGRQMVPVSRFHALNVSVFGLMVVPVRYNGKFIPDYYLGANFPELFHMDNGILKPVGAWHYSSDWNVLIDNIPVSVNLLSASSITYYTTGVEIIDRDTAIGLHDYSGADWQIRADGMFRRQQQTGYDPIWRLAKCDLVAVYHQRRDRKLAQQQDKLTRVMIDGRTDNPDLDRVRLGDFDKVTQVAQFTDVMLEAMNMRNVMENHHVDPQAIKEIISCFIGQCYVTCAIGLIGLA